MPLVLAFAVILGCGFARSGLHPVYDHVRVQPGPEFHGIVLMPILEYENQREPTILRNNFFILPADAPDRIHICFGIGNNFRRDIWFKGKVRPAGSVLAPDIVSTTYPLLSQPDDDPYCYTRLSGIGKTKARPGSFHNDQMTWRITDEIEVRNGDYTHYKCILDMEYYFIDDDTHFSLRIPFECTIQKAPNQAS